MTDSAVCRSAVYLGVGFDPGTALRRSGDSARTVLTIPSRTQRTEPGEESAPIYALAFRLSLGELFPANGRHGWRFLTDFRGPAVRAGGVGAFGWRASFWNAAFAFSSDHAWFETRRPGAPWEPWLPESRLEQFPATAFSRPIVTTFEVAGAADAYVSRRGPTSSRFLQSVWFSRRAPHATRRSTNRFTPGTGAAVRCSRAARAGRARRRSTLPRCPLRRRRESAGHASLR